MQQNINFVQSECCGCGVCSVICPRDAIFVEIGARGEFLYKANDNCISCGKCVSACPILKIETNPIPKYFYRAISKSPILQM